MLLYCHPNRMMSKDTPKMQFFWGIEELSKDWYLALYGNPGVLHQGSTGWQPVQMDPQGVAQWLRNPNQVPMDLLKRMAEPPQMVLSKANRSGDVSKKVKLDSGYVFVGDIGPLQDLLDQVPCHILPDTYPHYVGIPTGNPDELLRTSFRGHASIKGTKVWLNHQELNEKDRLLLIFERSTRISIQFDVGSCIRPNNGFWTL